MSTFTNWNGPEGQRVRTSDVTDLIAKYTEVITTLNEHIKANVTNTSEVHNVREFVKGLLDDYETVSGLQNKLTAYVKSTELAVYAKSEDLATYAKRSDIPTVPSLDSYAKSSEVTSAISGAVETLKEALKTDIATLSNRLDADVFSVNDLKVRSVIEQIQFTDKTFSANIGGSDVDGVYYILGMLVDKAGTAYVRFSDDESFSAVINFAVTPGWKGALSVTTDCELKGLKWKIVYGTHDSESGLKVPHAYLAVQASEWQSKFASTDGYGLFDKIQFHASGINFIPVDSDNYEAPNNVCNDVCDCLSGKGFSFSELATTLLGVQLYREPDNPYVTVDDITALDAIGIMSQWPEYDEDTGVAINVPEGYHACDGTDVLDTDDVSDEFREKYTKYPLMDYTVIKTKSTVEVNMNEADKSTQSLAEAVAALHGIKFYKGVSLLPDEGKVGEPVIVQTGNTYAIYVFKDGGWTKYSTVYNDINKTIGAIAAVIAAEHGADVYTVYSSATDLPSGPDVETGALAVVFDNTGYVVYKYNGTTWEIEN